MQPKIFAVFYAQLSSRPNCLPGPTVFFISLSSENVFSFPNLKEFDSQSISKVISRIVGNEYNVESLIMICIFGKTICKSEVSEQKRTWKFKKSTWSSSNFRKFGNWRAPRKSRSNFFFSKKGSERFGLEIKWSHLFQWGRLGQFKVRTEYELLIVLGKWSNASIGRSKLRTLSICGTVKCRNN